MLLASQAMQAWGKGGRRRPTGARGEGGRQPVSRNTGRVYSERGSHGLGAKWNLGPIALTAIFPAMLLFQSPAIGD